MEPQTISTRVLESFDQYQQMLLHDQKLQQLMNKQKKSRNSILQGLDQSQEVDFDQLDKRYEKMEEERLKYLQNKLNWLYQSYPQIFDLIVGETPPSRELLKNVLTAYLELTPDKENELAIVKKNMENLRKQNGLPEDFFDWNAYHQTLAQFR